MRRGIILMVLLVAAMALGASAARASGGGGCGAPVSEGTATTVAIRQFCFESTITHVEPGDEVTFVNEDPVPHNVLGANGAWGSFETLRRGGGEATYRFDGPGVFPYVCAWHPGMVGAIVVGDAEAAGPAATAAEHLPRSGALDAALASARRPSPAEGWTLGLAPFGAGIVIGSLVALVRRAS